MAQEMKRAVESSNLAGLTEVVITENFKLINQSNNCFRFSLPLGMEKVKKRILYLWYLTKASTTIHTVQSLYLPDL
ncbi:hypothetical protein DTO271D3_605 [Paecilomyces variotii]|nr:hypothetical protein DTO271D3_605 [Paecilomyces variotii]